LRAQVIGKIESWCGREASCVGREVLIKSIAQAVPTYSMSCFLLPIITCKKIRAAAANYWWGSSTDNRHMHWISWERLNQPKFKGGMGFRDLRSFNLAMLGKQGWRFVTRPDSLCARVLKGRYFHDTDFMSATRKRHASSTWRVILAGREVVQHVLFKRVVPRETTDIWGDRWISEHFGAKLITLREEGDLSLVSHLLLDNGSWDETFIRHCFLRIDAEAILR
jgi:hypothetical protein